MAALTTIVFDFDGTLVRTREASWALFRETNERFGLGVDSPEARAVSRYFGRGRGVTF